MNNLLTSAESVNWRVELERRLSEMAIEVVALTEENRVLKLGRRRNRNEREVYKGTVEGNV